MSVACLDVLSALRVEFWTTRGHTYAQSQETACLTR